MTDPFVSINCEISSKTSEEEREGDILSPCKDATGPASHAELVAY